MIASACSMLLIIEGRHAVIVSAAWSTIDAT